jgi:hypothetical protein
MQFNKYTITVDQVYDADTLDAFKKRDSRWRPTGEFRPPKIGEIYLNVWGHADEARDDYDLPRIILLERKKVKRKQIIYTQDGEPRLPKAGEFYQDANTEAICMARYDLPRGSFALLIFKREEKEIEVEE